MYNILKVHYLLSRHSQAHKKCEYMKKMLEKKETLLAFPSATEGEPIANEPTRERQSQH